MCDFKKKKIVKIFAKADYNCVSDIRFGSLVNPISCGILYEGSSRTTEMDEHDFSDKTRLQQYLNRFFMLRRTLPSVSAGKKQRINVAEIHVSFSFI